jgi:hypothetical protein
MKLNLPVNGLVACVNGVVWNPWVIVGNSNNNPMKCNGYALITINTAQNGLKVCANSPVPSGWYTSGSWAFYICDPYDQTNLYKSPMLTARATPSGAGPVYVQHGNDAVASGWPAQKQKP